MDDYIKRAKDLMTVASEVSASAPQLKTALEIRAQTYVLMDIAESLKMMAYPLQCIKADSGGANGG